MAVFFLFMAILFNVTNTSENRATLRSMEVGDDIMVVTFLISFNILLFKLSIDGTVKEGVKSC